MKGIVFTEFFDMVDKNFGSVVLENIITKSHLKNQGAYTAVGYYDHQEIVTLVTKLSEEMNIPIPDLLDAFGQYLFKRFRELYPNFFKNKTNSFDFLQDVDQYIHIEVRKIYPDAELPSIETQKFPDNKNKLILIYRSKRHMHDLALGLIKGCIAHFAENITVNMEVVQDKSGDFARFNLIKQ